MSGWVKMHRSLCHNDMWLNEPFSRGQAWVDLILLASHKDTHFFKRGILVEQKRGQVAISIKGLGLRWKWTRNKVKKFINDLKILQQIEHQNSNVTTLITLINYEKYQEKQTPDDTASRPPSRPPNDTPDRPLSRSKEGKKVKKTNTAGKIFTPPSVDDVRVYCLERGNNIFPEDFVSFYQAKGWMIGKNKMKDWKACVRTWERNNKPVNGGLKATTVHQANQLAMEEVARVLNEEAENERINKLDSGQGRGLIEHKI